jgi:hypothetical protein
MWSVNSAQAADQRARAKRLTGRSSQTKLERQPWHACSFVDAEGVGGELIAAWCNATTEANLVCEARPGPSGQVGHGIVTPNQSTTPAVSGPNSRFLSQKGSASGDHGDLESTRMVDLRATAQPESRTLAERWVRGSEI